MASKIPNAASPKETPIANALQSASNILRMSSRRKKEPMIRKPVASKKLQLNKQLSMNQEEAWKQNKALQKLVERYVKTAANSPGNRLKKLIRKKQRKVTKEMMKTAYGSSKIIKIGTLQKVGGRIKTWKTRFFVLKKNILFYFESQEAYEEKALPKGWVRLREMIPQKEGSVCNPTSITWRMKFNAFAIELPHRTFVICAKSNKERMAWMSAIQETYVKYWHSLSLNPPLSVDLLENDDKRLKYEVKNPKKFPGQQPETVDDLNELAERLEVFKRMEESEQRAEARRYYLRMCFIKWKAYKEIVKLEREYTRNK